MKLRTRIMTAVFAIFIGTVAVCNWLLPKQSFSENENRVLAEFPELTWEQLVYGKTTVDATGKEQKTLWTTEFETYVSDHFMLRDQWVGLKSLIELGVQKKDAGGVYFAGDGYLIEQFWSYDKERFESNLTAVAQFVETVQQRFGIAVQTMPVPTAGKILEEKLPAFAPEVDQSALLEQMKQVFPNVIDVTDALTEHREEGVFYKTDHHWTSKGAYYAYAVFCEVQGRVVQPLSWYREQVLSTQFLGTTYSKANLYTVQPETMVYYENPNESPVYVEYRAGDRVIGTSDSMIAQEYLQEKDKYSAFLNGNQAITKITTGNANGRKLLIIKDSYANSFTPFVASDYSQVHMLDLRAFRQSVPDYMEQNGITDVLILYNIKNFTEDANLYQLNK